MESNSIPALFSSYSISFGILPKDVFVFSGILRQNAEGYARGERVIRRAGERGRGRWHGSAEHRGTLC